MDEMPKSFFNPYDQMAVICRNCLERQVRHASDYTNDEGLLVCGICGETKQTYISVPNPDKSNMAKLLTTKACGCDRKAEEELEAQKKALETSDKIRKLRKVSLIDKKFKDVRFDDLERTPHNEKNLKLCVRYAERFSKMMAENQGLLMWGNVGTGKTYAAAAIANALLDQAIPVVMVSFVEILKEIEANRTTQEQIESLLNTADLVIFDDLGAERNSNFALEKVYGIIDSRYRRQLPMIITTNLTMELMKSEEDIRYCRIYDRIFETCYPMQFTGPSWRRIEANKRFTNMPALLADE